jgi:hypothetical protein
MIAIVLTLLAAPDALAYQACHGHELLARATDVSWTSMSTATEEHRKLREQLHVLMPTSPYRVMWYAQGGDLATTTFSVIATRRDDGVWHTNAVGQSQVWIQGAAPTLLPTIDRDLSAADSRKLDAALRDPCLYAAPTFLNDPAIVAGGLFATLEVEVPGKSWRGGGHGFVAPQVQAVTDLIGTP